MFTDQDARALNYCLNALNNYQQAITFVNGQMVFPNGLVSYGPLIEYGLFTDASNYRRLRLTMDAAGAAQLLAEGLGTGATGNTFDLLVNGTTVFSYGSAGVFSSGLSIRCGSSASYQFGSTRSRISSSSDGTLNFANAAGSAFTGLQFAGTQVLGVRNTGWTAQTAVAAKGDLGASPTVGALASWASAIQAALTTHGILGA